MGVAIPIAMGLGQAIGSTISSYNSGGGPNLSDAEAQAARDGLTNPFVSTASLAADEGARRVTGTAAAQGDPLADALARQEYMRQQQWKHLSGVQDIAEGRRSLVREQAALEQQRLQSAIMGQAAGARGSYAQNTARRAAPTQSSLIGARMVAPTNAAAEQERDAAMDQYASGLSQMSEQDAALDMNYIQQRRAQRGALVGGEQTKQYGVNQATTSKQQEANNLVSKGLYS